MFIGVLIKTILAFVFVLPIALVCQLCWLVFIGTIYPIGLISLREDDTLLESEAVIFKPLNTFGRLLENIWDSLDYEVYPA